MFQRNRKSASRPDKTISVDAQGVTPGGPVSLTTLYLDPPATA